MPEKWYVVTRGTKIGIFDTWIEAAPNIRVKGAIYQSFETYEKALAVWEGAKARGEVKRILDGPKGTKSVAAPCLPSDAGQTIEIQTVMTDRCTASPTTCTHSCPFHPKHPTTPTPPSPRPNHTMAPPSPPPSPFRQPSPPRQSPSPSPSPSRQSSRSPTALSMPRPKVEQSTQTPRPGRYSGTQADSSDQTSSSGGSIRPTKVYRDIESDISEPDTNVTIIVHRKRKPSRPMPLSPSHSIKSSSSTKTKSPSVPRSLGASRSCPMPENGSRTFLSAPSIPRSVSIKQSDERVLPSPSGRRAIVGVVPDVDPYPSSPESGDIRPLPVRPPTGARTVTSQRSSDIESYPDTDTSSSGPELVASPSRPRRRKADAYIYKASKKSMESLSPIDSPHLETPDIPLLPQEATHTYGPINGSRCFSRQTCVGDQPHNASSSQSTPHHELLAVLGLSQPSHISAPVYSSADDPRSPMLNRATVPELTSFPTFGRPSPLLKHSLNLNGDSISQSFSSG